MTLTPDQTVAIVLAAGGSRRFGPQDKLMASFHGEPLAIHAAQLAAGLLFKRRLAVCRAESELVPLLEQRGFEVMLNARAEQGMGTSLALGAQWAEQHKAEALAVFLADMPAVTSAHVAALFAAYDDAHDVVFSFNGEARLPPALIGRRHFRTLAALEGDQGARELVRQARVVEASPAELRDIDHVEQIEPQDAAMRSRV